MTRKMSTIQSKIHNNLWTKYCLSSHLYCPFMDISEDLQFIPEQYHQMYLRTHNVTDPLDDLANDIAEAEANEYRW